MPLTVFGSTELRVAGLALVHLFASAEILSVLVIEAMEELRLLIGQDGDRGARVGDRDTLAN